MGLNISDFQLPIVDCSVRSKPMGNWHLTIANVMTQPLAKL